LKTEKKRAAKAERRAAARAKKNSRGQRGARARREERQGRGRSACQGVAGRATSRGRSWCRSFDGPRNGSRWPCDRGGCSRGCEIKNCRGTKSYGGRETISTGSYARRRRTHSTFRNAERNC